MGYKGLLFGLLCKEVGKRILPNAIDLITSFALTILFGFTCSWSTLGYVIFFILSLILIYLVSRLVHLVRIMLKVRSMKKKLECFVKPVSGLASMLKK